MNTNNSRNHVMHLVAIDYIVFGLFMCISVGVGIYYAIKNYRKSNNRVQISEKHRKSATSTDEYLMGGRNMPILPTSLSLLTTFLSGITLFGTPAELFQRGLLWWLYYLMGFMAFAISGLFFVPIFYKLGATSVYEYFEHRFHSKFLRRLCASIFIVNTIFYMGVVIYAPAIALTGVTGYGTWPMILLVGVTSTMYTTVGGLKAVVWTDTLQAAVMYIGLGVTIVKGTIDVGGFGRIWQVAMDSGRVANLGYVSLDPAQYNSVWISIFGGTSFWISLYGLNQMAIQRYCSLPTIKHARWMVLATCPLFVILGGMACFIGLIVLAYFHDCNPIETGEIDGQDQLVILFAVKVLNVLPGLSGLFLAVIFAATLSTMSSGINSLSAVCYEDLIKPFSRDRFTDSQATLLNQAMVFTFGALSTGMAFAGGPLGGIIKASIGLMGTLSGPVLGLFILGVFYTRTSTMAATIAFIVSATFSCSLWIWNYIADPYAGNFLPTNTTVEGCGNNVNFTIRPQITAYDPHYGNPNVFYLARISPYILPFFGICLVILIGIPLSHIFKGDEEMYEFSRTFSLTLVGRKKRYTSASKKIIFNIETDAMDTKSDQNLELMQRKMRGGGGSSMN